MPYVIQGSDGRHVSKRTPRAETADMYFTPNDHMIKVFDSRAGAALFLQERIAYAEEYHRMTLNALYGHGNYSTPGAQRRGEQRIEFYRSLRIKKV